MLCVNMAGQFAQLDPSQLSKTPSVLPPLGLSVDVDEQNPLEPTIISVTSMFIRLAQAYTKIKKYSRRSWDDGKFHVDTLVVTCVVGLVSPSVAP